MITGREGHTVKSAVANDDASSPPVITNNAYRVLDRPRKETTHHFSRCLLLCDLHNDN